MIDATLLHEGRHPDPFALLGRHGCGNQAIVRVFLPGAQCAWLIEVDRPLRRLANTDVFEWQGPAEILPTHYRLAWVDATGQKFIVHDPYSFAPQLSLYDLHLFNEGRHLHAYRVLGAHARAVNDITGVLFSVWAPNAHRVSVVGDFNGWDRRQHLLRRRGSVPDRARPVRLRPL